jgi:RNA polymerase sigma factor for flagellar operon FliA
VNGLDPVNGVDREAFLEAHLPLVKRVYSRLKVGLPPQAAERLEDDLLGAGAIGLIQAYERYDQRQSTSFESFAAWRIRGAMLDELRRQDWLSKQCRRRLKEIQRAWAECEQALGHHAGDEAVAAKLGISAERLREEYVEIGPATLVFLEGLAGEDGDWKSFIADPRSSSPEEIQQRRQLAERLGRSVEALPAQERTVLTLLLEDELGQSEIAQVMGVSPSRVSQIYARAVLKLQASLLPLFK